VISQALVPKIGGGRCMAVEVMVPNAAIRNLIREDKIHQIYSQMQIGQAKFGMQTMNQSLCDLWARKLITQEEAMARSAELDELKTMMANAQAGGPARPNQPGRR
jgi:twitching motility protein PilT